MSVEPAKITPSQMKTGSQYLRNVRMPENVKSLEGYNVKSEAGGKDV
jgi:hypothetical protein